MKKIIYSLVIMIAAGSLFTSCVENTEPQGIKDLREAKADYLASLSKLREADAEKVKAEAAVKQAEAATEQAKAAQEQAKAEAAQIMKDLLAARTDYEKEVLNAKLDSLKAAAELAAIKAEGDLAQAQWDLEVALRRIASASFTLTPAEDSAITNAATNLNKAQKKYNKEFNKLNGLKRDLWIAEYDHAAGYDTIGDAITSTQLAKKYQDSVIKYEGVIQRNTEDIARLEKAKEGPDAVAEVLKTFADSIKSLQADSLAALTEKALYDASTLLEANKKYNELVEAFKEDSIPDAPTYLFAEINSDKDTVAKTYPLSGTGEGLDTLFAEYVNNFIRNKSGKTASDYGISVDSLIKNIEVGGKDFKEADLDTATEILGTIVEALSRHLVVVDDSLRAKTLDSLKKEAAKADTAYWKARKALEAGYTSGDKDEYIKTYEKFFAVTVGSDAADTTKALKKVVFTWSDTTFSFKKEDCIVKFDHSGNDSIIATNTLKIVLDGVDGKGYSAGSKFVKDSKIFKGTEGLTLFAEAIRANQYAKEAENFEFLEKQLDNIKTQYAAIVSDLKAYNDQYAADSKAHKDGVKALYGGVDTTKYPRVKKLEASVVENGKWTFYGKQVEFANEVAAEYPALVKATLAGNAELHARIVDLNVYVDTLNSVMAQWAKFDDPTNMGTVQNVNDIIQTIDSLIDGCKTRIADAQQMVDIFEKAVAMAEQGYDDYTIDVTKLKQQIALSESKLAQLEAVLEIRKAEYDAIIAEYGIKDAE